MQKQQQKRAPCGHRTCGYILSKIGHKKKCGVGAVIYNNYYDRKTGSLTPSFLLGKERGGSYKGMYNLLAGGLEHSDCGCFIKGIIREINQEGKLGIKFGKDFDRKFRSQKTGRIRVLIHNGTPIFIGYLNGISRRPLNQKIKQCNQNRNLPWCEREMDCVDWFKLSDCSQLEGKRCKVSSFASGVIKRINKIGINNF